MLMVVTAGLLPLAPGCRAEDSATRTSIGDSETATEAKVSVARPPRARGCEVPAVELPEWKAAKDVVIVDTRSAEDFRRVRIPGSINVPSNAIRTKAYLKPKRVLLVNGGGSGSELESVCQVLRQTGFETVGILEGGLIYWAHYVGELAGERLAERSLNRLSVVQLAREVSDTRWLFLNVSPEEPQEFDTLVPGALRAPGASGASLRRAVENGLQESGRSLSSSFVLVTDQRGEGYDRLEADLEPLALTHLYFLDGGVDGYRAHQVQQRQIALSAARGCPDDRCGAR